LITINGDADLDGHIHRDLLGMIRRTISMGDRRTDVAASRNLTIGPTGEIGGPVLSGALAAHCRFRSQTGEPAPHRDAGGNSPLLFEAIQVTVNEYVGFGAALLLEFYDYGRSRFFHATLRETGRIGPRLAWGPWLCFRRVSAGPGILLIFCRVGAGVAACWVMRRFCTSRKFCRHMAGEQILGEAFNPTSASSAGSLSAC